jgi:hypothetical protein
MLFVNIICDMNHRYSPGQLEPRKCLFGLLDTKTGQQDSRDSDCFCRLGWTYFSLDIRMGCCNHIQPINK